MSSTLSPAPRDLGAVLQTLRANRNWFLALGVLLILVGLCAITLTALATFTTILALGVMLLVAAGGQIASAIWTRGWDGVLSHMLAGLLYGVLGFLIVSHPAQTAAA